MCSHGDEFVTFLERNACLRRPIALPLRLSLCNPKLFLGTFAFGHVTCDLGKAHHLAGTVVHGAYDCVCPKTRSVFAQSPAFGLRPPCQRGTPQMRTGSTRSHILRCIKHRKMLPDDFVAAVPLDALCALVPRHDETLWVKHENCVVLYAIDEQTQPLLALPQPLFGRS